MSSDQNGWIKLHRKIQDNELWFAERFTKAQAWVDILLLASYKQSPDPLFIRGNEIRLKRGQSAYAITTLAKRWKWNERTVDRFLAKLQENKMISYHKSSLTTIITINNYDLYQSKNGSGAEQDEIIHTQLSLINTEQKKAENGSYSQKTETFLNNSTEHGTEQNTEQKLQLVQTNNNSKEIKEVKEIMHDHVFPNAVSFSECEVDYKKFRPDNFGNNIQLKKAIVKTIEELTSFSPNKQDIINHFNLLISDESKKRRNCEETEIAFQALIEICIESSNWGRVRDNKGYLYGAVKNRITQMIEEYKAYNYKQNLPDDKFITKEFNFLSVKETHWKRQKFYMQQEKN